ncbi:EAL domain-containing protein [Nitratifractor sp.]
MLRSLKEERARHFRLALRIGIPVLVFVMALVYGVFYREEPIALTAQNTAIFLAMLFAIVYFIFFALELSRKETLLDRVTEGYHYESFLDEVRKCHPRTLAVVQIDNLAVINENYGVRRADEILRVAVDTLDKALLHPGGKEGWIGRKNGAEFLLAIDEEPEKVEKELERFVKGCGQLEDVEVDFVFAVIRNNIEDPEKAIEQLRDLVAQRHRFEDAQPAVAVSDAKELTRAEQEVIEALERGDLLLLFRPLLNLHSQKTDIYEVGVKMRRKDGSSIAPREFLPIVNRHNLGERYDLLIVERVLEAASRSDASIGLSFNLSPFSLRKTSFLDAFYRRLEASEVEASRLIVELYERRSHHRPEEYFSRLKTLKRWGVRLCLDNFGSSNASMEYLRRFPFDMIQFDREYTFDLERGKSLAMLKSFVAMAHEMGMLTGVKWVDDRRKIEILSELGVDYIQGFAVGKVVDEEGFIRINPRK